MPRRVLIMGAAGRDFHNFNVAYRGDRRYEVVAFTATQIPYIDDRMYPPSLAGERYPNGIPIHDESELAQLIRDQRIDDVDRSRRGQEGVPATLVRKVLASAAADKGSASPSSACRP